MNRICTYEERNFYLMLNFLNGDNLKVLNITKIKMN